MNCYKTAQEHIVVFWTSGVLGGNFQKMKEYLSAEHSCIFGEESEDGYRGRYDPKINETSIVPPYKIMKYMWKLNTKDVVDDIPNRLIKKLMSEFPGANMYLYPGHVRVI